MQSTQTTLRIGIPKGRMQEAVLRLLSEAGLPIRFAERGYRAETPVGGVNAKLLKPQNIVEMLATGSRDAGFVGADRVAERGLELVELLDTGLDPVRLVAAAPAALLSEKGLRSGPVRIVSEYERLTKAWIEANAFDAAFTRSFGATEVFPPDDADCIVDLVASGATLAANGLREFDQLLRSSTRLYASPLAMEQADTRSALEALVLVLRSVLEARGRVMVEVNVSAENLDCLVGCLPSMREPTVAPLHAGTGYAVKAAVPRSSLPDLIPELKRRGGTDIVVAEISQIVP